MKLVWLTDVHLNCINLTGREQFYQDIVKSTCNGVLISGDIAEAPSIVGIMNEMADFIKTPIYFVLGNHDYYYSNVEQVREAVTKLTETNPNLFWLPASGLQQISDSTILLGQDGWADTRLGDYVNSTVALNDSRLIEELCQARLLGKFQLQEAMQKLADTDAKNLKDALKQAVEKQPQKIIVLTHVPPFKEVCMNKGHVSNDNWLPYFTSKATGDVLLQIAQEHPNINFLVLCGHTHHKASCQPQKNLSIKVGRAEYARPEIQKIIEI